MFKRKYKLICSFYITIILLSSGCSTSKNIFTKELPYSVSGLPNFKLSEIDNYNDFVLFVNKTNFLISILNEHELFDITPINITQETFERSKEIIDTYGPIISSYNDVIDAANNYKNNNTQENLNEFYIKAAVFGFEIVFFYDFGIANTSLLKKFSAPAVIMLLDKIDDGIRILKIAEICPGCAKQIMKEASERIYGAIKESMKSAVVTLLEEISKRISE